MISSYCTWGRCVQVDPAPDGGVYVSRRHTGDGVGTVRLRFSPAEWEAFTAGVVAGEFGLDRIHATEPPEFPDAHGQLPKHRVLGPIPGCPLCDHVHGKEPLKSPVSLPRVAPGNPDAPCSAVTSDLRAHAPHRGEHA